MFSRQHLLYGYKHQPTYLLIYVRLLDNHWCEIYKEFYNNHLMNVVLVGLMTKS